MTALLPALFTALAVSLTVRVLLPPRSRLRARVNPYSIVAKTSLGRTVDSSKPETGTLSGTTIQRLFAPPVQALARGLGQMMDSGGEESLLRRLRQAHVLQDIPDHQRLAEYRMRQLASAALGGVVGLAFGVLLGRGTVLVLALGFLGFIGGVTRWRGRIDSAIESRRERARIELYTVNQLLAMRTRVGGGVIQAVQHIAERGDGVVVGDLRDALRLHRGGLSAFDAFTRIADMTAEPFAARTYRLLGASEERGADLGSALLALSTDVREARRDALRRRATKRRAAMLIPIIGLMAPVMLLFIVAPITDLVFGITR